MEITSRDYKRVSVVRVVGRVDSVTAPQFEDKLKEFIAAGKIQLVVEMDATDFLSSAGARVLIATQKTLKPRGGQLALAKPSQRVRDVLHVAGLESLFQIFDDTEAAVGAL